MSAFTDEITALVQAARDCLHSTEEGRFNPQIRSHDDVVWAYLDDIETVLAKGGTTSELLNRIFKAKWYCDYDTDTESPERLQKPFALALRTLERRIVCELAKELEP